MQYRPTAGAEAGPNPVAYAVAVELIVLALLAPVPAAAQSVPEQLRSPGHGTRFARYFRPGSDDVIVAAQAGAARRLRGDWEPIDLLVLVHNAEWDEELRLMAERAATRVQVQVLVPERPSSSAARFRAWSAARCVSVRDARLDTPWIRDYGPVQVFDGEQVTWLDYAYYPNRRDDDGLPAQLADHFSVPLESLQPHVDGGALVSNGRGLCAMTDASLAGAGLQRDEPAALERFAQRLGCRGLAVLPALDGEQTGHADVLVQFLAPDVVAVAAMNAERSPQNSVRLDLAVGALRRVARALASPLHVVRIPMHAAGSVFYSYLNATRVRDLLFVPDYRAVDPALQADAHARLQAALPEITLVAVPADGMIPLGGAIHCITLGLNVRDARPASACGRPEPAWPRPHLRSDTPLRAGARGR